MESIDMTPEAYMEMKLEFKEFIKHQFASHMEEVSKKINEETGAAIQKALEHEVKPTIVALENKIKILEDRLEHGSGKTVDDASDKLKIMKQEIATLDKLIGVIERETKVQGQVLQIDFDKFKDLEKAKQQTMEHNFDGIQRQISAITHTIEAVDKLSDSITSEIARVKADCRKSEEKFKKLEEDLKTKTEEIEFLRRSANKEANSMKTHWQKIQKSCKISSEATHSLKGDLEDLKNDHRRIEENFNAKLSELTKSFSSVSDKFDTVQNQVEKSMNPCTAIRFKTASGYCEKCHHGGL